jgi:hypothetical protein
LVAVHAAGHHVAQRRKLQKGLDQLEGTRNAAGGYLVGGQRGDILAAKDNRA